MTELIGSVSIEALLAARDQLVGLLTRTHEELEGCFRQLDRFGCYHPRVEVDFHSSRWNIRLGERDTTGACDPRIPPAILAAVDRLLWGALMTHSGVKDVMDRASREKLIASLAGERDSEPLPELTADNIEATMRSLASRGHEFFANAVEAVFRRVSWEYRTNEPHKLKRKIILSAAISVWETPDSDGTWRGPLHCETLIDLERVVSMAAGQGLADHTCGVRSLRSFGVGKWVDVPPVGGDQVLMRFKLYKNRNAHVEILSDAALDELNRTMAARYPNVVSWDRDHTEAAR